MGASFAHILETSRLQETLRLNRDLPTLMPDEYQITSDMERSLSEGTYQFPDAREIQTGRRVLTRTQDYFSAKVHLYHTPFYFHRHTFVELLYMYSGNCLQFIENLGTCVTLHKGDIFILAPNVVHALLQEEENAVLIKVIIPTGTLLPGFTQRLGEQQSRFWAGTKDYYHYLHYTGCTGEERLFVETMMTEYYTEDPYKNIAQTSWLQLLLIALSRREGQERRYKLGHSAVEMGRITEYIYEHSETVTLDGLAREFSFSPSYLSRAIKEHCNMKFLDLLREYRLEKAATLLAGTEYPIEKIAKLVGYRSAASVYQGMKEKFGISPTEYRENYSQINREHRANE